MCSGALLGRITLLERKCFFSDFLIDSCRTRTQRVYVHICTHTGLHTYANRLNGLSRDAFRLCVHMDADDIAPGGTVRFDGFTVLMSG